MFSSKIHIDPRAVVEDTATIGDGTKIWHFCHIRGASVIGTGCNIGHAAYIDEDVVIGDRVKIQNKVSIFKGVFIENDVFIGPHVCFTNDLYPRAFNPQWEISETRIETGVSIGANATIRCGITIGKFSLIAAGTVVTKNIPPFSLVMGNPGQIKGKVCYCGQVINTDLSTLGLTDELECTHNPNLDLSKFTRD